MQILYFLVPISPIPVGRLKSVPLKVHWYVNSQSNLMKELLPSRVTHYPTSLFEYANSEIFQEHRNSFRRKVDPVVNGITDMQKFTPVKEIKTELPTVTMLSHVWYAKDIKTALLAADIIINEWGFADYRLDIYGAIDKAPTYSTECQEIIASKSLRGQVALCGTADPMKVLEKTWLFLNSSLSEGLPLALGEAALTGAPVVCTDVGASLRVLSDPDDFSRFSAVVAPNDARALARAQINLLGLLGEWSKYAEDIEPAPVLSFHPTKDEVSRITKRMYEKSEHRRKLGMMTRNIVQKSFSGDRYLREHEQMLWIGKSRKLMASRNAGGLQGTADTTPDIELSEPVDEEVVTIPRSAVQSWRSSAASSTTSLITYPRVGSGPQSIRSGAASPASPLMGGNQRPYSIRSNPGISTPSDCNSVLQLPTSKSLPVFAPKGVSDHTSPHRSISPMSAGGRNRSNSRIRRQLGGNLKDWGHEELQLYRNSDVSRIVREDISGIDSVVVTQMTNMI